MTQEEAIEMARQAGFPTDYDNKLLLPSVEIEAFAKLVEEWAVAKEREACAKTAEAWPFSTPKQIASAIRARGKA